MATLHHTLQAHENDCRTRWSKVQLKKSKAKKTFHLAHGIYLELSDNRTDRLSLALPGDGVEKNKIIPFSYYGKTTPHGWARMSAERHIVGPDGKVLVDCQYLSILYDHVGALRRLGQKLRNWDRQFRQRGLPGRDEAILKLLAAHVRLSVYNRSMALRDYDVKTLEASDNLDDLCFIELYASQLHHIVGPKHTPDLAKTFPNLFKCYKEPPPDVRHSDQIVLTALLNHTKVDVATVFDKAVRGNDIETDEYFLNHVRRYATTTITP